MYNGEMFMHPLSKYREMERDGERGDQSEGLLSVKSGVYRLKLTLRELKEVYG